MADLREKKRLKFSYDGSDFTLEFTPESVRKMEREGFDFTNMEHNVVNVGYDLFSGAFIAHHNYVPKEVRAKIYTFLKAKNKDGKNLIEYLAEMLSDELDWIVSKPEGNIEWAMA